MQLLLSYTDDETHHQWTGDQLRNVRHAGRGFRQDILIHKFCLKMNVGALVIILFASLKVFRLLLVGFVD